MTVNNSSLSDPVIKKFCSLCSKAHVSWCIRRYLFDEHADVEYLKHAYVVNFFHHLCDFSQDHWMLQLAKLHDPAKQKGQFNLSIDYIIEYGNWDSETLNKLKNIRTEMQPLLPAAIKTARHKVICHNDLISVLSNEWLGAFEKDKDITYFALLQNFVDVVHNKTCGGPFPLDDHIKHNIDIFMKHFKNGMKDI